MGVISGACSLSESIAAAAARPNVTNYERYEGVRPINIYLLRLIYLGIPILVGLDACGCDLEFCSCASSADSSWRATLMG